MQHATCNIQRASVNLMQHTHASVELRSCKTPQNMLSCSLQKRRGGTPPRTGRVLGRLARCAARSCSTSKNRLLHKTTEALGSSSVSLSASLPLSLFVCMYTAFIVVYARRICVCVRACTHARAHTMQFDTYGYKYTQGHLSAARVSACPASLLFFCSLSCMAAALNISAACV